MNHIGNIRIVSRTRTEEAVMNDRSWLRWGAAAGIVYAVLVTAGFVVLAASIGGQLATIDSPDEVILAELERPSGVGAWVGLYLSVIGSLLFVVFAARLWTTLRRHEGDAAVSSAAAFGSGIVYVGLTLVSLVFIGAERLAAGRDVDIELARILSSLNSGTYIVRWGAAALYLATNGAVVLASRVLPRWLGWSAAAISVALILALATPTFGLALIAPFLFVFWVLAASIVLLRRSSDVSERAPAPAQVLP
jgi:hypothetical protein